MNRAIPLLNEILAADGEVTPELLERVRVFVTNRHVTSDRIVLGCRSIYSAPKVDPKELPGMIVTDHDSTFENRDGEQEAFTYQTYEFPEAGSPRLYDGWGDGIVVPICGVLWRVLVTDTPRNGHDETPMAEGRRVVFERVDTDTPETEFVPWDAKQALLDYHQRELTSAEKELREMEEAVARYHAGTQPFENEDAYEAACTAAYEAYKVAGEGSVYPETTLFVTKETVDIFEGRQECDWRDTRVSLTAKVAKARKELEEGEGSLTPPAFLTVFGQPRFIQSECFPSEDGNTGMCLAVMETGHGDSGNENLMFAVDADGQPIAVWFEASSC